MCLQFQPIAVLPETPGLQLSRIQGYNESPLASPSLTAIGLDFLDFHFLGNPAEPRPTLHFLFFTAAIWLDLSTEPTKGCFFLQRGQQQRSHGAGCGRLRLRQADRELVELALRQTGEALQLLEDFWDEEANPSESNRIEAICLRVPSTGVLFGLFW